MVWSLDSVLRRDSDKQYAKGIILESIARLNRYSIFLSQSFALFGLFSPLHKKPSKNEQFPAMYQGNKCLTIRKSLIKQKEIFLCHLLR